MNFLDIFSKNIPIPKFIKIRLVGDELFHSDGKTERQTEGHTRHDEANGPFSQFCERA